MESRWLAIVSLIFLLHISLPVPSFSAASSSKSSIKRSQKRTVTKTIVKRTVATKIAKKNTASKNAVAAKKSPYSAAVSRRITANFKNGNGARYSPQDLVRAKVFVQYPLKGGIRKRSGAIRNLVLHSTETGRPADARTIVRSWNNIGPRHPGAQYLVDRDGTIIQTADPAYATVHVNDRTSLGGVKNDNSIGIEIVRTGSQKYTQKQLTSLVALVDYVKDRYGITRVCGHGEIQPSDRTDPVAFDWARFSRNLASIERNQLDSKTAYHQETDRTDG